MHQLLVDIGDTELIALVIGGVMFLIVYTLLAKWWHWREGRFVAVSVVCLTALFLYLYAVQAGWLGELDDDHVRVVVRLVIYTSLGAALLWVCVLLVMAQLERRRKDRQDAAERRSGSDDR